MVNPQLKLLVEGALYKMLVERTVYTLHTHTHTHRERETERERDTATVYIYAEQWGGHLYRGGNFKLKQFM